MKKTVLVSMLVLFMVSVLYAAAVMTQAGAAGIAGGEGFLNFNHPAINTHYTVKLFTTVKHVKLTTGNKLLTKIHITITDDKDQPYLDTVEFRWEMWE